MRYKVLIVRHSPVCCEKNTQVIIIILSPCYFVLWLNFANRVWQNMKMNYDCFSRGLNGEASLELTKQCLLGLVLVSTIIQATAVYRVCKCFSIKHLFVYLFFVSTNFSFKHSAFTHHACQQSCKKLLYYKSTLYYYAAHQ